MTDVCLNPRCDSEVPTIGVCCECANDRSWNPKKDGVEIELPSETLRTEGTFTDTKPSYNAL